MFLNKNTKETVAFMQLSLFLLKKQKKRCCYNFFSYICRMLINP